MKGYESMNTKLMVIDILDKWKFPVITESEYSIVFRYQLQYIQTTVYLEDGIHTLIFSMSGIFSVCNEKEMKAALKTCSDLNGKMPLVKLYIDDEGDLIIRSEVLFSEGNIELLMKFGLEALMMAKHLYTKRYDEIYKEETLLMEN